MLLRMCGPRIHQADDKYKIEKTDGSPTAPEAQYFVLRLDTDEHARKAVQCYADSVKDENPKLSIQLRQWVNRILEKMLREKEK